MWRAVTTDMYHHDHSCIRLLQSVQTSLFSVPARHKCLARSPDSRSSKACLGRLTSGVRQCGSCACFPPIVLLWTSCRANVVGGVWKCGGARGFCGGVRPVLPAPRTFLTTCAANSKGTTASEPAYQHHRILFHFELERSNYQCLLLSRPCLVFQFSFLALLG